jgi:tetratricopeptide (TPR) repeat protein
LETALGIEEAGGRVEALVAIAEAQAGAGEREGARETFSAALETARGIEEAWRRVEALVAIAEAQAGAGEREGARETFSAALETARGIEEAWRRVEALCAIAKAQAEAGEFSAALETVRRIEAARWRAEALGAIAKAQAEAGLGEGAVRTAEMILTDRNKRLPEIAEALVIAGDKEHFKQLLLPCAYYLDAAYKMCGLLARLYPKQVLAVAEVVRGEVKSESGEQL